MVQIDCTHRWRRKSGAARGRHGAKGGLTPPVKAWTVDVTVEKVMAQKVWEDG